MAECTYAAREIDCKRLDTGWADTLASLSPRTMLIVPDFPPFFPVSKPQPIREHRNEWGKETEGQEVASYMYRSCPRSIGAVMGAKSSVCPKRHVLRTCNYEPRQRDFGLPTLVPLTSRLVTLQYSTLFNLSFGF